MPHPPRPLPFPSHGPRERLARLGSRCLSDTELVAILLGTGQPGEPVLALADRVLREAGGLHGLSQCSLGALLASSGLGLGKAARLLAAAELGRRIVSRPIERGRRLSSSRDVYEALQARLAGLSAEEVWAIPLDAKNRSMGEMQLALGGLSACALSPADVFRPLMKEAAAGVILVHNHPSGEPTPSTEDIAFTERLCRAALLLGMELVDHVIVAREGYFSFVDSGLLRPKTSEV